MVNDVPENLLEVFKEYRAYNWFFLRPGGNWGDHLIYHGAEELAKQAGVEWTDVNPGMLEMLELKSTDCVYLHGSGGFNSWCSGQPFVDLGVALSKKVSLVVQGPATTQENVELLKDRFDDAFANRRCSRFLFFVREDTSYKEMQKLVSKESYHVDIKRDKDTALNLSRHDILKIAGFDEHGLAPARYHLCVFRKDQETIGKYKSRSSFSHIEMDPAYYANSFQHWLRIHIFAKSVVTDRLHSAIVSAILGKSVTLMPGFYHKNRSIYDFSLSSLGVTWSETSVNVFGGFQAKVFGRLFNSHKFNKIKCFIFGVPSS